MKRERERRKGKENCGEGIKSVLNRAYERRREKLNRRTGWETGERNK